MSASAFEELVERAMSKPTEVLLYYGTVSWRVPIIQSEGLKVPKGEFHKYMVDKATALLADAVELFPKLEKKVRTGKAMQEIDQLILAYEGGYRSRVGRVEGGDKYLYFSPHYWYALSIARTNAAGGGSEAYKEVKEIVTWWVEKQGYTLPSGFGQRYQDDSDPVVIAARVPVEWTNIRSHQFDDAVDAYTQHLNYGYAGTFDDFVADNVFFGEEVLVTQDIPVSRIDFNPQEFV